ncbi:hypothetical protein GF354_02285 [Candidatus Peregrinibacteria bacterium]|nr:hypothetical protein [Candidatus Peregrinibacteria bacterium]
MKKFIFLILVGVVVGSVGTALAMSELFSDVPENEWYAESVMNLTDMGIIEGSPDGTYRPDNYVNRAELAVILNRFDEYLKDDDVDDDYYVSEKFGIKFKINPYIVDNHFEIYGEELRESENGIGFDTFGDRIKVFYKEDDQSIESAILDLIENEGKDPNECVVVQKEGASYLNEHYFIDLADPEILFTEEELNRIADADVQAELDGGPFDGVWMERKIYTEHLIDLCTEYADPLGLGTSKTIPSYFEYNPYKAKNRFIFTFGTADQEFYEWNTIEFL